MTGTIINVGTVLLGGALGLLLGSRLPGKVRSTLMSGIGLFTVAMGLQMALQTENSLVVLLSMLAGGIVGEALRIEDRLLALGEAIKKRFGRQSGSRFTEGFVSASIVFCVGPMTILGAIADGLRGDYSILAIKSVLDGFTALAFASTMGLGVLFSTGTILVYQGAITLLASLAESLLPEAAVLEMTAAGGVIILGIGLRLLDIKEIRVANFIPALFFAPLLVAFF